MNTFAGLETLHFVPAIIVFLFYTGCFFLMVLFRNDRPLKSRKIAPFIGVLAILIIHVTGFVSNLLTYEDKLKNICILRGVIIFPLLNLATVAPFLNILQLFVIGRIKRINQKFYDINGDTVTLSWRFKILLHLSSNYTFLTLDFLFLFFTWVFSFGIYALYKFDCTRTWDLALGRFTSISGVVINVLIIMFCLLDFLLSWRLILKCKLKQLCIERDPNLLRFEAYFVPAYLIYSSLAYSGATSSFFGAFLITAHNFFTFLISGGFALGLTILFKIFPKCFSKPKKEEKVGYMLALTDENIKPKFLKFSIKELNQENIYIKLDIITYKEKYQFSRLEKRKKFAMSIFEKYLNGKLSSMELNLDDFSRDKLKHKMDLEKYDEYLFDEIETVVNGNLLDMFNRFKLTDDFIEFRDIIKLKEQMMEY
jgi:hypothetical protein